jgi:2,3-bisphosphoglycerate-independent phosphoglycerate mutase
MILDGFGIGKDTPFNAIANARMPFFKSLLNRYPHAQLLTHGNAVGLPDGVMGNSEVGHMTLGAGRTIYQDLTRISQAISNGSFSALPVLNEALRKTTETQTRLHLLGLLSDGGVHSHPRSSLGASGSLPS